MFFKNISSPFERTGNAMPQEMTKEQYIEKINEMLQSCADISLIDLIHTLLLESL